MITMYGVLLILFALAPANSNYLCSVYCSQQFCTGILPSECLRCDYPYQLQGSSCILRTNVGQKIIGGSNNISIASNTSSVLTSCGIYQFRGNFSANSEVILTYSPAIPVWFWIALIDIWQPLDTFSVSIPGYTQNINAYIASNLNYSCGNSQTANYFKAMVVFPHSNTTNGLTITITTTNQNNKPWGIKEPLILARLCFIGCDGCIGIGNNDCILCKTSGYYSTNYSNGTKLCDTVCQSGYGPPSSGNICIQCDSNCSSCSNIASNCTQCITGYFFVSTLNQCFSLCPPTYFQTGQTCNKCDSNCSSCINSASNCTACLSGYLFISDLSQCASVCPANYTQQNQTCINCPNSQCLTNCSSSEFKYNNQCVFDCPSGYFGSVSIRQCLLCDNYCAKASIKSYLPSADNTSVYIDILFTETIDFSLFPYQIFLNLTFQSTEISQQKLSYQYQILNSSAYRIVIKLTGLGNFTNARITGKINSTMTDLNNGYGIPLHNTAYDLETQIFWTFYQTPSLTGAEAYVTAHLATINEWISSISTLQYVQQIKKAGLFAFIFPSAQITSTVLLGNCVHPQNMYEAARFWGLFIFFDVPGWQQQSNKTNYILTTDSTQLIQQYSERRLLLSEQDIWFHFRRTGLTSFFLFDTYMPLLLILSAWIMLACWQFLLQKCKVKLAKKQISKCYVGFHKAHQIVLFYVMVNAVLEWLYFSGNSTWRIVSLISNILTLTYFLIYQIYVYRQLAFYPLAQIGNLKYDQLVQNYSVFLRNIRFEEYSPYEAWSFRHLLRPYNFHFFSFYKRILIMAAIVLFYQTPYAQLSALVVIQSIQLLRFLFVKPFYEKWRNVLRGLLDIVLLSFFIFCLVTSIYYDQILSDLNAPSSTELSRKFIILGWINFSLIFFYNGCFFGLLIHDLIFSCVRSDRFRMDQARRKFYLKKYQQIQSFDSKRELLHYYQKEEDTLENTLYDRRRNLTPLTIDTSRATSFNKNQLCRQYSPHERNNIRKWIQLGNLSYFDYEQPTQFPVKVEEYRIQKLNHKDQYQIQIYKVVQMYLDDQPKCKKKNNVIVTQKIQKLIKIGRENGQEDQYVMQLGSIPVVMNDFFVSLIKGVYNFYSKKDTKYIYLSIYLRVNLEQYEPGDPLQIRQDNLYQVIMEQDYGQNYQKQRSDRVYDPFPINYRILMSL